MATYKVQSNGKAQKGLKKGDTVVTGGGTYKITGVNADGTYKSTKINNITTSTYKGSYANSGGGSNSQYTGSSNGIKVNDSLQQAYKDEMNANSKAWYNADEAEQARLHARNQDLAKKLGGSVYDSYNPITGTWGGEAGGITADDIVNWEDNYNQENERPTTPKQDPRIQEYLDKYLNRDAFSYDVMDDPLYQQYADMYRREGDRAMRETMAEAAAGAGGMNTYAMTAAMQANNYYNSQLNDKIPELYQAAYDKYLKNIDLQLQDLGVLQGMDDTQYARYRDTMADWKDDKKFAYGAYMDAVNQNNWQTNFDNNNYWANKEFDYNDMWKNKEWDYNDMWANKEWDANRGDIDYERNQAEEETAKNEIGWLIQNGVTTIDPKTIEAAGLTQETVNQMIAYFKQQQALQMAKGTSSGGGSGKGGNSGNGNGGNPGGNGGGYDNGSLTTAQIKQLQEKLGVSADGLWGSQSEEAAGGLSADAAWKKYFGEGNPKESTPDPEKWDASGNWKAIDEQCREYITAYGEDKGKDKALDFLKYSLETGRIDIYSYMTLVNKYRG